MRKECDNATFAALKDKRWKTYIDQCTHEKFTIQGPDGNEIDIWMIKAKANIDEKDLAPIVHFHGGGGYAGSAEHEKYVESRLAVENKVCYFNVKFRLGPEVQYGTGHSDGKAAIEYMMENADKHGCDPKKLCITGESGGGWITMGSAILMSREGDKCDKVKLMLLTCPMLGALASKKDSKKEDMADWEKDVWRHRQEDFAIHTDNLEDHMDDPLLFPFLLPIEDMKKLPKCVLQTSEFDYILRDVHEIVPKMKEAGIYLDHLDYSGVSHGFQYNADEPKHDLWFQDMQ